ncbi:hypothetical protein C7B70_17685 [Chlorogloea sp. CCALA 695]|nr:hypothetical protein C7B70_17685 [Chlorogloea sp. CCALA 695]
MIVATLNRGKFSLNQPTHANLRQAALLLPFTFDLHFKLIVNQTRKPFITSDHPVVLYNQFLEDKKSYGSNTGIACKGLEIFIPLSPSHLLIFFDGNVYKIGSKSNFLVVITSETDVENLNLLQCISANENLYFNQEVTELQISHLMRRATQYRNTTKANVNEFTSSQNNNKIRVLLHTLLM